MSDHERPERLSNTSIGSTDNSDDDEDGPTIEIVVKSLTETEFEMTVFPTDTIIDIKSMIFRKEGIPMFQQHLLYYFKELDDESSLQDQGIKEGARLRLVLGMCGGPLSIRRPQPPLNAEPSSDIERLPDTNRDDADSGGSGSRLTVFVFRNGDSVNMLRVQENHDGTYSPLRPNEHTFASISLSQLTEHESGGASCSSSRAAGGSGAKEDGGGAEEDESGAEEDESGAEKNGSSAQEGGSGAGSARDERALRENLLTMDKMRELRRRMEMLRTQRAHARHHSHAGHLGRSVSLYGAPVWVDALSRDNKTLQRRPQRVVATRVIRGYRTVSWTAACVLASDPPWELQAEILAEVYHFVAARRSREGPSAWEEVARMRRQARAALLRWWTEDLAQPVPGQWTVEAIRPVLRGWIGRRFGSLTFRLVQVLSGHGCFGKYLHQIARREATPACHECGAPEDTALHTLEACAAAAHAFGHNRRGSLPAERDQRHARRRELVAGSGLLLRGCHGAEGDCGEG